MHETAGIHETIRSMKEIKELPERGEAERILEEGLKKNPGRWGEHCRNAAREDLRVLRLSNSAR